MIEFNIQGRTLTLPVEVRRARSWAAQFFVDAAAAQRLLPRGLRIASVAGRGVLVIPAVRYEDTDLDAYNEVGIAFIVRGETGLGVYIHHLPVNQAFTLEAGRTIWGYPKFMADIDIVEHPGGARVVLAADGEEILQLDVRRGWIPMPAQTLPTYTELDGVLRVTKWSTLGARALGRPGGGRLHLGTHPIAKELQALGLPKRALAVQTVPRCARRSARQPSSS
ncbi:MAG: acetoacetate decarboxylase family protein [Actinomycetota bacterium]